MGFRARRRGEDGSDAGTGDEPEAAVDFKHEARARRAGEDAQPWFVGDDDGPPLDVEAGISSNLRDDDGPGSSDSSDSSDSGW